MFYSACLSTGEKTKAMSMFENERGKKSARKVGELFTSKTTDQHPASYAEIINVEDANQEERTMSKEQMFTFEEYQTVRLVESLCPVMSDFFFPVHRDLQMRKFPVPLWHTLLDGKNFNQQIK
jgi:hypothetical protein